MLNEGGLSDADVLRLAVIRRQFLVLLALALMMAAFTSARFYMVSWLGERITTDLREAVYANVLRQRPEFFETLQTGEVLRAALNMPDVKEQLAVRGSYARAMTPAEVMAFISEVNALMDTLPNRGERPPQKKPHG